MRKKFIDEWCEKPPLKKAVLLDLLKKSKGGDIQARNKIIEHSGRLVAKMLIGYELYDNCMTKDELYMEALDGLMVAINRFDHSKGFAFSTYATYAIRTYVSRAVMRQRRHIKVPDYQNSILSEARLNFDLGIPIDDESSHILSMANTITVDDLDLVSKHRKHEDDTFDRVNRKLTAEALKSELDKLESHSGDIIARRCGLFGKKVESAVEIGKTLKTNDGREGITKAWVSILFNRGISKLKESEKLRELAMQL